MDTELETYEVYYYIREGKQFMTPSLELASKRSDLDRNILFEQVVSNG